MKREPSAQKNDSWYLALLGITQCYSALPPSLPGTIVVLCGIGTIAVMYLVPGTRPYCDTTGVSPRLGNRGPTVRPSSRSSPNNAGF